MKLFLVFLVLFLLPEATLSLAREPVPEGVSRFLQSRKIASIIYFKENSSVLSAEAKQNVDTIIPRLRLIDLKKVIVRIEGFVPREDGESNIQLSMNRAVAVMNYLRKASQLDTASFFIGCGGRDLGEVSVIKRHRVEIALYDHLLEIESARVGETILNW